MRVTRMVCAALTGALVVAAVAATVASAAKPKLVIKSLGSPAPAESAALEGIYITHDSEFCVAQVYGTLKTNSMVKDTLSFPQFGPSAFCAQEESPEYAISSTSTSAVSVASNGQTLVKLKPKLAITMPGPCTYEFSKLKLAIIPGAGAESAPTTLTGKLQKKGSNPACYTTESATFLLRLYSGENGNEYETELVP